MPEGTTGSTVPRRQLGRHLRDLRNRSQMTVRAAALRLEWSEAKMWRIETGQTSLRSLDAEAMCKVYGASAELTRALMALAKETKARGWWHSYGDVIPPDFDVYIGMEQAAASLSWYESELVPGLLQTEDYARTVIREGDEDDPDDIERLVRLRMTRQAILRRGASAPALHVVLNEAVLRRPVGGAAIMAGQLARLAKVATLPHVSLRVLPFSAGVHAGFLSRPFVLLEFPSYGNGRASEPPTVYVEGYTGALYLDKQSEIERYARAFAAIQDSALDTATSSAVIADVAGELAE